MVKSKKLKKILKVSILTLISLCIVGALFLAGTFAVVTADASLNEDALVPSANNLTVLDSQGNEILSPANLEDNTVVPAHTLNAFIAKEDKRFYSHNGIDYIRILGALKNNISSGEVVEGGSTITQQLIKNTHLSQEKTMKRKLKEIKLAKELEKKYSKEEILTAYLNNIYFGNNCFGIKSASSFYFNKPVANLTLAESAMLAGLISAPSVFNPIADLGLSKEKAKIVLGKMEEQNYISPNEHSVATAQLNSIEIYGKTSFGAEYLNAATAEALKILNQTAFPAGAKICIKTYLDSPLQKRLEEMTESEAYKAKDASGVMSGIGSIVLDNNTGGVLAFCGKSEYNLLELKRQPASTIKPILVYGPALEENLISPASFILDEPINIDGYAPQNATKLFYGQTTIRDNIVRSTNVPAVKIMNQVGIKKCQQFAAKLGIEFDEGDNNLAIALGGMTYGVTIKDLAEAYSTLSRGGNRPQTTFVKEILINDLVCYSANTSSTQVMKESTAFLLTDMLKSVAEYGTGRHINKLNLPVASKTGTNSINGFNHDGWNVSYTTEHTAVCWMGNLSSPLNFNSAQFNGSIYPTHFVADLFEFLYLDHKPADFSPPPTVKKVGLDKDAFLNHTLYLADNSSSNVIYDYFETNNLPPNKPRDLMELNLLEELNLNNPNQTTAIDYGRFIKKYGFW